MSYFVKEAFFTMQGEGFYTGRPAVFLRFTGCNLWSGREEDRADAVCSFCDTDFTGTDGVGGGRFDSAQQLSQQIAEIWSHGIDPSAPIGRPYVVCTGGEPLLQLDDALLTSLHNDGFEVGVETNGTLNPPDGIDWMCVSPKAGSDLNIRSGSELKLVFPQTGNHPRDFQHLEFSHFYLQPMDGPSIEPNTLEVIRYYLKNPSWKLSVQTHKLLSIP